MRFQHAIASLATLLFMPAFGNAEPTAPGPRFTATQLRADLREIDAALHGMSADLSHSVDSKELEQEIRGLDAQLVDSPPLTRDEAWRAFATLNPLLADGHLFVGFVDWRGDVRRHLADGGTLFPFGVRVTEDCEVSVQDASRHFMKSPDGALIRSVNGASMRELCHQMLERIHGDSRAFRADLLERRFWFYFWKVHGAPTSYRLTLESGAVVDLPGSTALPRLLADEEDFDRQFELRSIAGAAVLKLGTFAWPKKDEVTAFTASAFERLRTWKTKTLIIDLRDNGGGNDDQWIEGVMPYVATQRWRTASTYRKRVVVPDPVKSEKAGDVVDGEMQTWYEPQPDNPLRFEGDVYVAVGPGTYSSAVVMATVFQDFGFGKLIGSGDSVRASQSGGTRRTTLTNTGLIVVTPRFVLRRPSGAKRPMFLMPDVPFDSRRPLIDFVAATRFGR